MNEDRTYSQSEIREIQTAFGLRVERSKLVRWVVAIGAIAVLFALAGAFAVKGVAQLTLIVAAVVVVIFLMIMRSRTAVRCPGCEELVEKQWGDHCPECGAAGLEIRRGIGAHCGACGRTLTVKISSNVGLILQYEIKACTTCGVLLIGQESSKSGGLRQRN